MLIIQYNIPISFVSINADWSFINAVSTVPVRDSEKWRLQYGNRHIGALFGAWKAWIPAGEMEME